MYIERLAGQACLSTRFELRTNHGLKVVEMSIVKDLDKVKHQVDGVFIFYDGSRVYGYETIKTWEDKVTAKLGSVPYLVVGTKADGWISGVGLKSDALVISYRYKREYLFRPVVAMLKKMEEEGDTMFAF